MRLLIAGGRDYVFRDRDYKILDTLRETQDIEIVITGGATGADAQGMRWAQANNIPYVTIFPDWETHGKSAGPRRNRLMVLLADAVVTFPGGKGTQSTRDFAVKHGRKLIDSEQLWRA